MDWGDLSALIGVLTALAKFIHWMIQTLKSNLQAFIAKESAELSVKIEATSKRLEVVSGQVHTLTKTVDEMKRQASAQSQGSDRLRDELIDTLAAERKKTLQEFERSRVEWENDFLGRLKTILNPKKTGS